MKPAGVLVVLLLLSVLGYFGWRALRSSGAGPTSGGGPTVAVPAELGGPVPARLLDDVFGEAAKGDLGGMGVRLVVGKGDSNPVYTVGDQLRVGFSTGEDVSCLLFHRNASGAISLQHPAGNASAAISANSKWVSDGFNVTAPVGKESFLVICLPRRDGRTGSLKSVLEKPRGEWRNAFVADRVDFEVRR